MKKLLSFSFLLISIQVFSQIKYEPGYIINNNGQKTEVLILNKDWRDNPSRFSYKLSNDGDTQNADLNEIAEFGIGDYLKYERFTVPIDRSGKQVRDMTTIAEPEFSTQTVFLRQLLSGEANLYRYKEGALTQYYLSKADAEITPLIHKEYLRNNNIATNNRFRKQLYNMASCGEDIPGALQKVAYEEKDLIAYLESYHECRKSEYDILKEEGEKMEINFAFKAGVDLATFKIEKGLYVRGAEIDLDPSLRAGAEIEAVMPFNRNKWALYVEPTYNSQSIEKKHFVANIPYNRHEVDLTVDYKFLSIATGARHYMFLTPSSKVFLSAGLSFDVPLKTSVYIDRDDRYELDPELEETTSEAYLHLGLGYNYRGLSAEIRYNGGRKVYGTRDVDTHYVLDWESQVSSFSVLLGYQLF